MRFTTFAATALAATLAMTASAIAQPRSAPGCAHGHACAQTSTQHHRAQPRTHHRATRFTAPRQPARTVHRHARTPHVGEIARNGWRFRPAARSRFRAPPRGQEYRIVDDHLVLVDAKTLRIVAVLGLLGALVQ